MQGNEYRTSRVTAEHQVLFSCQLICCCRGPLSFSDGTHPSERQRFNRGSEEALKKHHKKDDPFMCGLCVGCGGGVALFEAADANRVQLCRPYSHAVWKTNWGLLDLIHHLVQTWRPLDIARCSTVAFHSCRKLAAALNQ